MKVFINKRVGEYSGGMCIVAANNAEEAEKALIEHFEMYNPSQLDWLDKDKYIADYPSEFVYRVHSEYSLTNWEIVPNIEADYDKPIFIAEAGYTE